MIDLELRDKDVYPGPEVLGAVLGDSYLALKELFENLAKQGFTTEWRFYHDGKAWLCKITDKKKTLAWLSVYAGYFRVGFYFLERHVEQIAALDIDPSVKQAFFEAKPSGRLIPLRYVISASVMPDDLMTVFLFKKSAK